MKPPSNPIAVRLASSTRLLMTLRASESELMCAPSAAHLEAQATAWCATNAICNGISISNLILGAHAKPRRLALQSGKPPGAPAINDKI